MEQDPGRDNIFAYVLVLILVIGLIWRAQQIEESYLDPLSKVDVYTSGATMRRLGQKFTATNQGAYTIIHDAERKSEPLHAMVYPVKK